MKTAIVLAGGLGTRLKSVVQDIPKPMATVNGRPFLEFVLDYVLKYQVEKVILSIGYRGEVIQDHFGENYKGITLVYSVEEEPLGTGGAIFKAAQLCGDAPFFVLNGDTLFEANLDTLLEAYNSQKADMMLALKAMQNFDRYGVVEMDETNRVQAFLEKEYRAKGLINGGVYVLRKSIFDIENYPERFSFEKDLLEKHVAQLQFYGLALDGYFIDIGIPEDYAKAQIELS